MSEGFGESSPDRLRRKMMQVMEKMPEEMQYTHSPVCAAHEWGYDEKTM